MPTTAETTPKTPLITKSVRTKLEKIVQDAVDTKGLVKTGKKIRVTPVSLRSFLQGGESYAKTLVRIARFGGMPKIAKEIEELAKDAAKAPKKKPAAPKKSSKAANAKKSARNAKKAVKHAPAKKSSPKARAKKATTMKAPRKTARTGRKAVKRAKVDRTPKEPISPLAGVPVGKELDRIEKELELEETPSRHERVREDELEVAE